MLAVIENVKSQILYKVRLELQHVNDNYISYDITKNRKVTFKSSLKSSVNLGKLSKSFKSDLKFSMN